MNLQTTKVGSKYQMVVPSYVREVMTKYEPGVRIVVTPKDEVTATLKVVSKDWVNDTYGSCKGWWGKDSTKYLKDLRNEWN